MKRFVYSTLSIVLIYGMTCTAATVIDDINKDVHNASGLPAYDFRIVLDGVPIVISHFDGFTNDYHFGHFETIVENETTVLRWSEPLDPNGESNPIPDCNWVHVGYRLDRHADILEACWTDEDAQCLPNGIVKQVTQNVDHNRDGTVTLTLKNTLRDEVTLSVSNVQYAVLDGETALDNLNAQNTDLELEFMPLPGADEEIVIEPGSSHSLKISEKIPLGKYLVYRKEGENYVDFGQHWEPPPVIPTLSEWGLIIMAVLLVSAGTIVIWQRRRVAA